MDSNDAQFNMWNDFDLSSLFQSSLLVNDSPPICKVCNRSNPSILKVFTFTKQSSPISIDCNDVKLDKVNSDTIPKQSLPISIDSNDVKFDNSNIGD